MNKNFYFNDLEKCKNFNDNEKDFRGNTKWHYLARIGDFESIRKGISENRCDPNIKNNRGTPIWHFLAWSGNIEALFEAFHEIKFDPNMKDECGTTLLHYLAWHGNYDYISRAFSVMRCYRYIDYYGYDILHYLAESGNGESFFKMLNEDKYCIANYYGYSVWRKMESRCYYEILCKAIDEKRVDPNTVNKYGHNILNGLSQENYRKLFSGVRAQNEIELLIKKRENLGDIPHEFRCPISQELMVDPVITQLCNIYDRQNIEKWFETHNTDPLTNMVVTTKVIFPSLDLQNKIDEWLTTKTLTPPLNLRNRIKKWLKL
jgi:ankyrin repeat protein